MSYVIITDSSADLPWDYTEKHDIHCIDMTVVIGNDTLLDNKNMDLKQYYARLRGGESASTSQIPAARYVTFFEPFLAQGKDILLLGLSHGLSESYTSACVAQKELLLRYPERKIHICSTLSVTLGLGILVNKCVRLRDEGMDIDQLFQWAEVNKFFVQHRFTVEDLNFLHRGGRVSRSSAVVGSLLGIKPMLHVDRLGKLVSHGKVRGRTQSLIGLVNEMEQNTEGPDLEVFGITHGDCEEEALFVVEEAKKRRNIKEVIIRTLGSTISAHSGPGTMAIFFFGKER